MEKGPRHNRVAGWKENGFKTRQNRVAGWKKGPRQNRVAGWKKRDKIALPRGAPEGTEHVLLSTI